MELDEFPGETWQLPLAVPVTHGNEDPDPGKCTAYIRVRSFVNVRDRVAIVGNDAVTVHVYEEQLEKGGPPPEPIVLRTRCGGVQLKMWTYDGSYEVEVPAKTGKRTFKYRGELTTLFGLTCKLFDEVT